MMKIALGIVFSVMLLLFARAVGRATSGALYRMSSGYPRTEDWLWVAAVVVPVGAVIAAYIGARRNVVDNGIVQRVETDKPKLARGLFAIGVAAFTVGVLFALSSDRYDTIHDLGLMLGAVGACLGAGAWYLRGSEA